MLDILSSDYVILNTSSITFCGLLNFIHWTFCVPT